MLLFILLDIYIHNKYQSEYIKITIIIFRWKPPYVAEDGHFEIGDIHETGLYNDTDEFNSDIDARLLKRSHSTGDLVIRRGRLSTRGGEEPRLGIRVLMCNLSVNYEH